MRVKKPRAFSGLLMCLLVLSLVLATCDMGGGGPAFTLTEFILLSSADAEAGNWNPRTFFYAEESIGFGIRGRDPDLALAKFVYTLKRDDGSVVLGPTDIVISSSNTNESFRWYCWNYITVGTRIANYTVELYAVDVYGNKSNTRSAKFSVR